MNKESRLDRAFLSKPGDTILETIESLRMTQIELADRMGKTPSKINDIISGKEPITINTALQLEKVFGIEADFWLRREATYRERLARIEEEEKLECWIPWANLHPLNELRKCGFITAPSNNKTQTVQNLLLFYGVVSPEKWELLYVPQYSQAQYRKSEVHQHSVMSITAWLRIGELEVRKSRMSDYNKDGFKEVMTKLKKVVCEHPTDFAVRIQQECAMVGVAVVYTPCLPKAPISGAARWIGGNPLIQLSDRYKSNDRFWFTFYHEAAHVLLHGKKEVFLEDIEGYHTDEEREEEANDFAARWLLPERFANELGEVLTESNIVQIAHKYGTHPGIVVGRLQKLKRIDYSFGNQLKEKISLF